MGVCVARPTIRLSAGVGGEKSSGGWRRDGATKEEARAEIVESRSLHGVHDLGVGRLVWLVLVVDDKVRSRWVVTE